MRAWWRHWKPHLAAQWWPSMLSHGGRSSTIRQIRRLRSRLRRVSLRCAVASTPLRSEWRSLLHGARRAEHGSSSSTNIGKRVGASEAPIFGIQWLGSRLEQVNSMSGHGLTRLSRASTGYGATSLRCLCCSNAHTHSSPRISTPPRSRAARNAPAVKRSFVRGRCRCASVESAAMETIRVISWRRSLRWGPGPEIEIGDL